MAQGDRKVDICPELFLRDDGSERQERAGTLDLRRFERLRYESGGRLILSWLRRAWDSRDCANQASFEPFIYAWISLNGWASCVTGYDADRRWVDTLRASPKLGARFTEMVGEADSALSRHASAFQQLWPVFKVSEIRAKGVQRWHSGDRSNIVKKYLDAKLELYQPRCWVRHQQESPPVPADWPHTLEALYRVRCNLFHGEKGLESEMDALIVGSAFRVLLHFLYDSGFLLG